MQRAASAFRRRQFGTLSKVTSLSASVHLRATSGDFMTIRSIAARQRRLLFPLLPALRSRRSRVGCRRSTGSAAPPRNASRQTPQLRRPQPAAGRRRRRRGGDRRHRRAAARLGRRRHPAGEHARRARRPRDRRDQHQRAARCARAADRQRPRPRRGAAGAAAQRPAHLRASASFATFRPKRSSGSRSCPRKSRSNTAIAPTRRS